MMPKRGVSLIDVEGKPFFDPEADAAFLAALKANLGTNVELVEIDTDINDATFATRRGGVADRAVEEAGLPPSGLPATARRTRRRWRRRG